MCYVKGRRSIWCLCVRDHVTHDMDMNLNRGQSDDLSMRHDCGLLDESSSLSGAVVVDAVREWCERPVVAFRASLFVDRSVAGFRAFRRSYNFRSMYITCYVLH